MATLYGFTAANTWSAYLVYTITETPTTYTINITDYGMHIVGTTYYVTYNDRNAICTLSNGTKTESTNVYFGDVTRTQSWKNDFYAPYVWSNTINKTTSVQTATVSFALNLPKWSRVKGNTITDYGSTTSTASTTLTIPALKKPTVIASAERLYENPKGIRVTANVDSFAEDVISAVGVNINGTAYSMGTGRLDADGHLSITKTFSNISIDGIIVYCTATGKGGVSDSSESLVITPLPKPNITLSAVRGKQGDINTIDVTAKVDSFAYDRITSVSAALGEQSINLAIDGSGIVGEDGYITATGTFIDVTEGSMVVTAAAVGMAGVSSIYTLQVPSMFYTMDIGGKGKEIAFGASASTENLPDNGLFTCDMDANFNGLLKYKNASLIDVIYPVGSIYMSVNNTNPGVLIGGTWEAWGQGCVPVGVDVSQTEFSVVEKTGGEKVHALTPDEHSGGFWHAASVEGDNITTFFNSGSTYGIRLNQSRVNGTAHNNLQPYITCYMWKRTA